ncbi:uncharacterized protein LOC128984053 [Macrosteles quadrilineatus]|uniref:uncharacterized protein LOC128984053 n=1 Tax=Macrosteles quadrilineatus TaxID=74068 RepID=UPI0023E2B732|nr:uncharacterized protein LOC128984053 [Macrosteles quadrilineatus]
MENPNSNKRPHRCCFAGCSNTKGRNPSLRFFTFSIKRAEICEQWIVNCANDTLSCLAPTTLNRKVVCELHFTDECFTSSLKTKLNQNAVPTKLSLSLDSPQTPAQASSDTSQLAATASQPSTSRRSLFTTPTTSTTVTSDEPPVEVSPITTPLFKKHKPIKGRKPTPGKMTPNKRRMYRKLQSQIKLRKMYQQAGRRLKGKKPNISKSELLEAIKGYLPEKVSDFFAMQLNHCNQTTKPYTDKEKQQALS